MPSGSRIPRSEGCDGVRQPRAAVRGLLPGLRFDRRAEGLSDPMMREESARLWRLGALLIVLLSTVPNVGFASSRLDGASKSMVFLAGPPKIGEDGQVRRPTGSGFFIINGAALLLVTAEHVAPGR